MGATTPIEVVKYIKFPDRRLVSGFLTVNVVSHNDNDNLDDASDEYFTGFGSGEHFETTYPFNGNAPNDPDRTGLKHSFGDYDCLLFWVAGGMTLHAPTFSNERSQAQLEAAGFINNASGPAIWEDGSGTYDNSEDWFLNLSHPCQHFLKSHLIGRINNGYGHIANTSSTDDYYKIPAITTHQFEYDDNSGNQVTTDNITGNSTNSTTGSRKGKHYRYVVSNGTFSNDPDGDFVDGVGDLSDATKNTYFPMVENVEVYGKHSFTIPKHSDGVGGTNFVYSNGNTSAGNYAHQDGFWSMVIKIKMRGYNPSASSGQATHEFFKSRTNVMFQPFGETASFDIANSLHTS
jgi:hypothetical protein